MEFYGFTFTYVELALVAILFCLLAYQLYFYIHYMNGVKRYAKKQAKGEFGFESQQPPVSVIICAKDEAENLRKFLPMVLKQDYPEFEVIVINDGSTDATADLLRDLQKEYSFLKSTFIPVEAKNRSTKKLGITLGVKASRYDYLLFTDADCIPQSEKWISLMMRNFSKGTEFVLGYGGYFQQEGFLNRIICFDTLFIALQYMGMALAGKPYMGVGRNLAYRKDTFYKQNGFASSLKLISGDDDLMVNSAADDMNTAVEIDPESITWSEPNETMRGWKFQKRRHLMASSYYSSSSKFRLFFEPFSRALFYMVFVGCMIFCGMIPRIVAAVFFLIRFVLQCVIINKGAKHFGLEYRFILSLLFFDIYLPLVTLQLMIFRSKSQRW